MRPFADALIAFRIASSSGNDDEIAWRPLFQNTPARRWKDCGSAGTYMKPPSRAGT